MYQYGKRKIHYKNSQADTLKIRLLQKQRTER